MNWLHFECLCRKVPREANFVLLILFDIKLNTGKKFLGVRAPGGLPC